MLIAGALREDDWGYNSSSSSSSSSAQPSIITMTHPPISASAPPPTNLFAWCFMDLIELENYGVILGTITTRGKRLKGIRISQDGY